MQEIIEKIKIFNDANFIFNEKTHTYTYNGEKFTSVTTFLKNFSEPFDADYWSKRKAKDRIAEAEGISREQISDEHPLLKETIKIIVGEWDNKRDTACILGSSVHLLIENKFRGINVNFEDVTTDVVSRYKKFEKLYDKKLYKLIPLEQEVRMFSKKLNLAGTFDALFLKNGKPFLIDWKSNSTFTTDSDRSFNKLKKPFEHENDNNLNVYSIQLSLYRLMLEEVGIETDGAGIVHIPPDDAECKIYNTKDYRSILRSYFGI